MPLRILADSNIVFAREAFTPLGHVILCEGREITNDRLKDIDMLLVRSVTPVNRALLEGSAVKFVSSATAGTDHVDIAYLRENNIGFCHAPGSNANSVAEYVLSAIFHCARKKNRDLATLTLGIIGAGNIGSRVFHLAQALGMRCLLNDPPKKTLTGSDIYQPLSTVLKESDIITIHVPLNSTGQDITTHMVNAGFISLMKKGAFLINTSRGGVVDEGALKNGRHRLGCVVLDVWNNEPQPDTGIIGICDIATPHIAGYSYDGKVRGTEMICSAANSYFFKQQNWRPPPVTDRDKLKTFEIKKGEDPLFLAVTSAYPLMEDDIHFRKIVSLNAAKRGEFFDEMRSNYPKRFEFKNFSVAISKKNEEHMASVLTDIGFSVIDTDRM
jgi:erythronate-4-phosphate dehydrogenase